MTAAAATAPAERARLAMQQGRLDTAEAALRQGLQKEPQDAELLLMRADLFARYGQLDRALEAIRQLQAGHPGNRQYLITEARYLSWLSRTATSAAKFRSLLQQNPEDHSSRLAAAANAFYQGDWREAQTLSATAITGLGDEIPANSAAYYRAMMASGRVTPAFQQAQQMDRRTKGRDAELGLLLASIHGAAGNAEEALTLASRRTTDSDIRQRQVAFQTQQLIASGRKGEGLELASNYATSHAREYNALITAGDAFTQAGHYREARAHYEQAQQSSPRRQEALVQLAKVARLQGRTREAISLSEEAVRLNPEWISAWLSLSESAQVANDRRRAWEALDEAERVSPDSALVFREKLRVAFRENDHRRFFDTFRKYDASQPADAWVDLWAQKWASRHGEAVDTELLQSLLDPLAPDLTAEALHLLRSEQGGRLAHYVDQVPVAPSASLDEAARENLLRQARLTNPGTIGVGVGYEYSILQPSVAGGAKLHDWHEGFLAAYWRRRYGMTFSGEYRTFSRFGESANQILLGWDTHLGQRWVVGVNGGAAFNGDFIPRWRLGVNATHLFTDTLTFDVSLNRLHFKAEPVYQFVPSVTWQWHPRFSSMARLYATHSAPAGAPSELGFAGLINTSWQFVPSAAMTLSYGVGEEAASAVVKGLVGDKFFHTVGIEFRVGAGQHVTFNPLYRYEVHQLYDMHVLGLGLNLRF